MVCPRCKYGDFCALCLGKWANLGFDTCGNKDCKIIDEFLENSPWDKVFNL